VALGATAAGAFTSGVAVTVIGGSGADTINASAFGRSVSISGGDGADSLIGSSGSDTLLGGDGNDTLVGGAGADYLEGGTDTNTYVFNTGDIVSGETVTFTSGATEIFLVDTSTDFSLLNGGATPLSGLTRIDIAIGQTATFTAAQLNGLSLNVNGVSGGPSENLIVNGTSGNDVINLANISVGSGISGAQIFGSGGNDTITGTAGNDTIAGGAGVDVFVVNTVAVAGIDFISDFNWNEDKIDTTVNVTYFHNIGDIPTSNFEGEITFQQALDVAASQNGSPGPEPDNSYDAIMFSYAARTYILITLDENDGTPVGGNTYKANTDILIDITGFSGSPPYVTFASGPLPADGSNPFI